MLRKVRRELGGVAEVEGQLVAGIEGYSSKQLAAQARASEEKDMVPARHAGVEDV